MAIASPAPARAKAVAKNSRRTVTDTPFAGRLSIQLLFSIWLLGRQAESSIVTETCQKSPRSGTTVGHNRSGTPLSHPRFAFAESFPRDRGPCPRQSIGPAL